MVAKVILLIFAAWLEGRLVAGEPLPNGTVLTPVLSAKIDALFAPWNKPMSPGMAVAVISNGLVLHQRGYGMANLEQHIPITSATVFDAASVAKQFTGMALAMLVKQGAMRMDEDARKYVPEVPDFGRVITLNHLVHHLSGLRDWPIMLNLAGWRWEDVITFNDTMEMLKHQRDLNFPPGDTYLYSNTGYNLLVAAMERATGKQFSLWTEQNLFTPLAMTHTHFHCEQNEVVENLAQSYRPTGDGKFEKVSNNLTAVGSSSLFTTIEDLTRWLRNFGEGRIGGTEVIQMMKQEGVLNNGGKTGYGLGLAVGDYHGLEMINHTGGWASFASLVLYFPRQKTGVALLSNLGSVDPYGLGLQVAEICLAEELKIASHTGNTNEPAAKPALTLTLEQLAAYAGAYLCTTKGVVRRVTLQDNRLWYVRGAQSKSELLPVSEGNFLLAGGSRKTEVRFSALPSGTGLQMRVLTENEGPLTFLPVAEKTYSAQDLAEYAGVYRSEELDARYAVWVQGGALKVRSVRKPDQLWTPHPECQDVFTVPGPAQIRFQRDDRHNIVHLYYSDERNWNVRFDKQ
jgi:CubicO group peptidase (beta-lactamase class C family)